MIIRHVGVRFALALLVFTATGFSAATPYIPPTGPGSTLVEDIAEVVKTRGGVVIASNSPIRSKTRISIRAENPEILSKVAEQYGLTAVTRPGSLALQRTYDTPSEPMELELKEIQYCSTALSRLVAPLKTGTDAVADTKERIEFAAGFTADQRAKLIAGPLLFPELSPNQQRTWLKLTRFHAFGLLSREAEKFGEAFKNWSQARFEKRLHSTGVPIHSLTFPSAYGLNGRDWITVEDELSPDLNPRPSKTLPSRRLPEPKPYSSALRKQFSTEAHATTLESLAGEIKEKSEVEIETPSYADSRQLVVAAVHAQLGDVLQSLQDLYGWELFQVRERKFIYRLPRPTAASDPQDLRNKIASVIPPPIMHTLNGDDPNQVARKAFGLELLLKDLKDTRPMDWSAISVTDLTPSQQDQLAQIAALAALKDAIDTWRKHSDAPAWLTHTQAGQFRWKSVNTGKGLLTFEVNVPGHSSGWGWVVGSSSLETQMQ